MYLEKVKAWLERGGLDKVDETVYALRADPKTVPEKVTTFWEALQIYQDKDDAYVSEEEELSLSLFR